MLSMHRTRHVCCVRLPFSVLCTHKAVFSKFAFSRPGKCKLPLNNDKKKISLKLSKSCKAYVRCTRAICRAVPRFCYCKTLATRTHTQPQQRRVYFGTSAKIILNKWSKARHTQCKACNQAVCKRMDATEQHNVCSNADTGHNSQEIELEQTAVYEIPVVLATLQEITFWQDDFVVVLTLTLALILDACVIVTELQWDENDVRNFAMYLTNQVFFFGLLSKLLMVVYMMCYSYKLRVNKLFVDKSIEYRASDTCGNVFVVLVFLAFFAYGACLWGVYGAFFILIYMDDHLLQIKVCPGSKSTTYQIGEVLIWNHIRHVFVLFLHMTLLHCLRRHLRFWYRMFTMRYQTNISTWFVSAVLACVSAVGIGHLVCNHLNAQSDSTLYKYKQTTIGHSVVMTFAISCIAAIGYYVFSMQSSLSPEVVRAEL